MHIMINEFMMATDCEAIHEAPMNRVCGHLQSFQTIAIVLCFVKLFCKVVSASIHRWCVNSQGLYTVCKAFYKFCVHHW